MKKIFTVLTICIFCSFAVVSCGTTEKEISPVQNEIVYDVEAEQAPDIDDESVTDEDENKPIGFIDNSDDGWSNFY